MYFMHSNSDQHNCICVRIVGPETVYLVIIDGGADWVVCEDMARSKYPWINFIHCVAHEGSLMIKDICKLDEVGTRTLTRP